MMPPIRRKSRANRRREKKGIPFPERRSPAIPEIEIETRIKGSNLLVIVKNPLVAENCYHLRDVINRALTDTPATRIIVNMENVPYANSPAIALLLELHRRFNSEGKQFILYRVIRRVKKVLEILNLDTVFDLR